MTIAETSSPITINASALSGSAYDANRHEVLSQDRPVYEDLKWLVRDVLSPVAIAYPEIAFSPASQNPEDLPVRFNLAKDTITPGLENEDWDYAVVGPIHENVFVKPFSERLGFWSLQNVLFTKTHSKNSRYNEWIAAKILSTLTPKHVPRLPGSLKSEPIIRVDQATYSEIKFFGNLVLSAKERLDKKA